MRHFLLLLAAAGAALWLSSSFAQAEKAYVLGKEAVIYGEAFCSSAEDVMEVAGAYARSLSEGEETERAECEIPTFVNVDMKTHVAVLTYRPILVRLVRVVKTVAVPGSTRHVTFVEVTDRRGAVFYMTTYAAVKGGDI